MLVNEIFFSIQGESTYAGLPCAFIRLGGCNLSCTWCDTPYARDTEESKEFSVDEILHEIKGFTCPLVEITGGEPLLQNGTKDLVRRLLKEGKKILIETNGSVCLDGIPEAVIKIVDVKCPSSGHADAFLIDNIRYITPQDEVKFVIGDRNDYEFAKRFVEEFIRDRTTKILFAPVRPGLDPRELADWILKDRICVRLQLQIHSYIWKNERGR